MTLFRSRDISNIPPPVLWRQYQLFKGSLSFWLTLHFLSKCQFPTQTFSERFSDAFNLLSYQEFWEPDMELCCDQISDKYPHWVSCQNVKLGCEFLKDQSVSEGRIKASTREWHTSTSPTSDDSASIGRRPRTSDIFARLCEKMFVMWWSAELAFWWNASVT